MPIHICSTCGTLFPDAPLRPPIVPSARMNVSLGRPQDSFRTTPEKLAKGHVNAWRQLEIGLFEISHHPRFAIGQRALLLRTSQGNILWDCIACSMTRPRRLFWNWVAFMRSRFRTPLLHMHAGLGAPI